MSNERDELAQIVADADYVAFDTIAGRILDAGYRKPRTVTTAEELDALPDGTIIYEIEMENAAEKYAIGWRFIDNTDWPTPSSDMRLPALVLYTPKES